MPVRTLLGLLVVLACRRAAPASSGSGNLEVAWSDSGGQGRLSGPAQGLWCARDTMLSIVAARNDSAFGIALFARDSVRAEGYPIAQPSFFTGWRPQATAGLRLFTGTALKGFESASGTVTLSEASVRRVSGRFDILLKANPGSGTVQVTGLFRDVTIAPDQPGCGRSNKPGQG